MSVARPIEMIDERATKYWVCHLVVRVTSGLNFAHLLLMYYKPYFRAARNIFRQGGDIYFMMACSLLLPLYVAVETWWMFNARPSHKRALIIDWAIAVLWFLVLWGFVLYARLNYLYL